ncbi:phytanoyl-CoA dioxygenase family protein [Mucilaginibacter sp. OK098]|uniref:phytanoyl-CoA dioxygenase family protein n=1 Tax=Mucilaginibacter sp. OK098 TaxID=1855297 RepID=UPI0009125C49|nr:phytanoyl-CoA dioxygenase family protein [Mucilaginibacter sp. OK098]SHM89550.1 Ectoine hydroxylase-related dioxygenase, phytanoyl-CoA dioxygenase (PhyH) family [Mucilaginibacter sp. OK098]
MPDILLPPVEEVGQLQIMHLKRYWHKCILKRNGQLKSGEYEQEFQLDKTLLFTLGLGLEQTVKYLYHDAPAFEQFEQWIIETNGKPSPESIIRFNNAIVNKNNIEQVAIAKVLDDEQLDFWERNGYLILKNAVPKEDCEETIEVICNHIQINRDDPDTWYNPHPARQGIMVQLFQHPILEKNRSSEKVRAAFEQLWNRTDLWVSADRVGFNPPETENWKFPGPRLHWDTELNFPMPFGLQGILYLADTEENQGAFSLVPGFQHRLESWIGSLPPGANPYKEDLHALGCIPIAANAGDFIVWHQALPHGSSPNTSSKPRFVQYFTYDPAGIDQ